MDETMSSDLTWEQQLIMLRAMSERMGVMHEAQVLQLRLWPFSVDPNLPHKGQEIRVDLEAGTVHYVWVDSDRPDDWTPDKRYQDRLKILDRWTRWMLGSKFKVQVDLNNVTIFVKDRGQDKKRGRKGRNRKKRKRR